MLLAVLFGVTEVTFAPPEDNLLSVIGTAVVLGSLIVPS